MNTQKIDIDEILDNDVKVSETEEDAESSLVEGISQKPEDIQEKNDEYEYIYSGKAMNERELLHFSSKEQVNMVLVAGPFKSGKTTMLVMMYYLFREGLNKKFDFKGSLTMRGFWDRSKKLLLNSGSEKPDMGRTLRSAQEMFLNLELKDKNSKVYQLIFTDISGELFSDSDFLKDLPDYYIDSKNIILVMDGEAMGDAKRRRIIVHDLKVMADNLLKYQFMTKNTRLQVVCTKMDRLSLREDYDECKEYIKKKYEELKEVYGKVVSQMNLFMISALNLEDVSESRTMEQIIEKCVEEDIGPVQVKQQEKISVNRFFERYGMRN